MTGENSLDAFLARVAQYDPDGEVWLTGWSASRDDASCTIVVELFEHHERTAERWRVVAAEVHEWRCELVSPGEGGTAGPIAISYEHPLLWRVQEPIVELFFRGSGDAPTVAAAVFERHVSVTRRWLPVDQFVNGSFITGVAERLAAGYGSLATGPTTLIAAYAEELDRGGYATTTLEIGQAPDAVAPPGLRVLTFNDPKWGKTAYVIARSFTATLLPTTEGPPR